MLSLSISSLQYALCKHYVNWLSYTNDTLSSVLAMPYSSSSSICNTLLQHCIRFIDGISFFSSLTHWIPLDFGISWTLSPETSWHVRRVNPEIPENIWWEISRLGQYDYRISRRGRNEVQTFHITGPGFKVLQKSRIVISALAIWHVTIPNFVPKRCHKSHTLRRATQYPKLPR